MKETASRTKHTLPFARASQLRPFLALFEERGGHTNDVLEKVNLGSTALNDPAALISGNALYGAVHEMSVQLADPYFGSKAAEKFVLSGPIFVRNSFLSTTTLAGFLTFAILELSQQIKNIRYDLSIDENRATLTGRRYFSPSCPTDQLDAATVTAWIVLIRKILGPKFVPSAVAVRARSRKAIPPEILPASSCAVTSENAVTIRFPSDWLKESLNIEWEFMVQSEPTLSTQPMVEELIGHLTQQFLFAATTEGKLTFDLTSFSGSLGKQPRELQRTLKSAGLNYRQLVDEVKSRLAKEWITRFPSKPLEQIGEELGYSGSPSFSRAFKRWHGVAPSSYRSSLEDASYAPVFRAEKSDQTPEIMTKPKIARTMPPIFVP